MLETIEKTGLAPSRPYIFSKEAQIITAKLLQMHVMLMQSPEGLKIVMSEKEQEVHVPHNRYCDIKLESKFKISEDLDEVDKGGEMLLLKSETTRMTLGAAYKDGVSMYLSFTQEDTPVLDFREDPYTEHILDLYDSHFDAA